MGIIYLAQNYVSDVAGQTRVRDADAERALAAGIVAAEMPTRGDIRNELDAALDECAAAAAEGRQAFAEGVVERAEQLIDGGWLMDLQPIR